MDLFSSISIHVYLGLNFKTLIASLLTMNLILQLDLHICSLLWIPKRFYPLMILSLPDLLTFSHFSYGYVCLINCISLLYICVIVGMFLALLWLYMFDQWLWCIIRAAMPSSYEYCLSLNTISMCICSVSLTW